MMRLCRVLAFRARNLDKSLFVRHIHVLLTERSEFTGANPGKRPIAAVASSGGSGKMEPP